MGEILNLWLYVSIDDNYTKEHQPWPFYFPLKNLYVSMCSFFINIMLFFYWWVLITSKTKTSKRVSPSTINIDWGEWRIRDIETGIFSRVDRHQVTDDSARFVIRDLVLDVREINSLTSKSNWSQCLLPSWFIVWFSKRCKVCMRRNGMTNRH